MKKKKKYIRAQKTQTTPTANNDARKEKIPINHLAGILLGLIAIVVYSNTINYGYVLDDTAAIVENQFVQKGIAGIPDLLKTDFWYFNNLNPGYYRPLSLITFAFEQEIFKGNPMISHLLNVLLFAFSGYLAFIVLSKLFQGNNFLFPFAIILIFILHPIHTEVVANIKSRDELLSFLNVLLTVWFTMKFFDSKKTSHLLLSLFFFYLALLSKETAMTGALLVPVILYFRNSITIINAVKRGLPYVLLVILFLIQKKILLGTFSGTPPNDLVNYPYRDIGIKIPTTFLLFLFSLKLLIFPHPLRYDYSYNQIPGATFTDLGAIAGFILFILGIVAIFKYYRSKSPFILGLIIIYVTLIPSLAFTILRGGIFAERFLFFPSLGFSIVLVSAIAYFLKCNFGEVIESIKKFITSKWVFSSLVFVMAVLYSIKTFTRNRAWKDELTLYSTDIKTGMKSAQNLRHYGTEILRLGLQDTDPKRRIAYATEAVAIFKKAVQIFPKFSECYNQIGSAYQEIFNVPDSAIYYYNKSIESAPTFVYPYYNLGTIYQKLGNNAAASYYYNTAINVNPTYQNAITAEKNLKDATGLDVQINPLTTSQDTTSINKDAMYYFNMGNYYASLGDYVQAEESFNKSITLDVNRFESYINLANCYGMQKNYEKAIEVGEKLLRLDPNNKKALQNLSLSYQLMGNEAKAKEYLKKVKALENQ